MSARTPRLAGVTGTGSRTVLDEIVSGDGFVAGRAVSL